MTRETKAGIVVSCAFLALTGTVLMHRFQDATAPVEPPDTPLIVARATPVQKETKPAPAAPHEPAKDPAHKDNVAPHPLATTSMMDPQVQQVKGTESSLPIPPASSVLTPPALVSVPTVPEIGTGSSVSGVTAPPPPPVATPPMPTLSLDSGSSVSAPLPLALPKPEATSAGAIAPPPPMPSSNPLPPFPPVTKEDKHQAGTEPTAVVVPPVVDVAPQPKKKMEPAAAPSMPPAVEPTPPPLLPPTVAPTVPMPPPTVPMAVQPPSAVERDPDDHHSLFVPKNPSATTSAAVSMPPVPTMREPSAPLPPTVPALAPPAMVGIAPPRDPAPLPSVPLTPVAPSVNVDRNLRPVVAVEPPPAVVEPVKETVHVIKSGDTFASLSQMYYGSGDHAAALAAYYQADEFTPSSVKEGKFVPGEKLLVPPLSELTRKPAAQFTKPSPGPLPDGVNKTQVAPPAAPVVPVPLSFAAPANSAKVAYKVTALGGETMFAIAGKVLANGDRWMDISKENTSISPELPVPAGTVLTLPTDAKVPPENRP